MLIDSEEVYDKVRDGYFKFSTRELHDAYRNAKEGGWTWQNFPSWEKLLVYIYKLGILSHHTATTGPCLRLHLKTLGIASGGVVYSHMLVRYGHGHSEVAHVYAGLFPDILRCPPDLEEPEDNLTWDVIDPLEHACDSAFHKQGFFKEKK